jgi:SAM-dependent methyltransferase
MAPSSRLPWAVARLDLAPTDRVLEVGCGHGVLVSLIAARLTTGLVVGIDRSATMIAAATRRNRPAIEAGRVRLMAAALTEADLEGQPFDVVVSFNVRAFWTSPAPEWDVVDRVLAPGGRAVVAWSLMGAEMQAPVEEAAALELRRGT